MLGSLAEGALMANFLKRQQMVASFEKRDPKLSPVPHTMLGPSKPAMLLTTRPEVNHSPKPIEGWRFDAFYRKPRTVPAPFVLVLLTPQSSPSFTLPVHL